MKKESLQISSITLLMVCALFMLPGCDDQLLPVDPNTPGRDVRIAFSEKSFGEYGRLADSRLFVVNPDGSARVDLTSGVLNTPPGADHAAIVDHNGSLWISPLNAPPPVSPQMVISRNIDEHSVALSPTGARITYTYQLRETIIAGMGGDPTVVLPVGVAYETTPSFSPDGKKLAFLSTDSMYMFQDSPGRLYVVDIDGSGLHALATVEMIIGEGVSTVEWSPSGDRIAYHDNGKIRVATLDGGSVSTIAPGRYPSWTPEGDSVLYTGGGSLDLYLAAADGSGTPRQITGTTAAMEINGRFSPDRKKILYTSFTGPVDRSVGSLSLLDLMTGTTTILSEKAFKGFWVK